jgi:hypothetical protein
MRSADLSEPAATRQQNLYTCHSSAPYSLSVTLIYVLQVSVKLTRGVPCFTASGLALVLTQARRAHISVMDDRLLHEIA